MQIRYSLLTTQKSLIGQTSEKYEYSLAVAKFVEVMFIHFLSLTTYGYHGIMDARFWGCVTFKPIRIQDSKIAVNEQYIYF